MPTPDRDPWPEEASASALAAYESELERTRLMPAGDPVEPFERAAVYLRDKARYDIDAIPELLRRIVDFAANDRQFRDHPRHGDLFTKPSALMGRRIGSADNLGVDVKIPEWINRMEAARPRPRPSTHVSGFEGTENDPPPTPESIAAAAAIIEKTRVMLAEKSAQREAAQAEARAKAAAAAAALGLPS